MRLLDYRPVQGELHRLVRMWFQSGRDIKKLLDLNSALKNQVMNIRMGIVPMTDREPKLALLDVGNMDPRDPLCTATGLFVLFLLNPNRGRLGGPCAKCQRFYVKTTQRQTVYCSASCGHKSTARNADQLRRTQEQERRVKVSILSIAKFSIRPRRSDWKDWVAKDAQLTKHWLTRAERKGAISAPKDSRY